MTTTIRTERRGAALWIRLDRPDTLNALSPLAIEEINAELDRADEDPTLRALVLASTGRAFCAGADLTAAQTLSAGDDAEAATAAFVDRIRRLADRLEQHRLPVIAAVNGLAIAGGLELVLACDLVIAARSARLGDGHAKFGLLPGAGSSVRLPRKIGPTRAKYLMFTAEYLPAEELATWGLVTQVVADDSLDPAVDALVAKLEDKSPIGLARMKQLVNDGADQPTEIAMRAEQTMSQLHSYARDRAEGLRAFAEKRKPKFSGQ